MPRALTYTPEVQKRTLAALRAGSTLRDAVGFAGVPWRTFCDWMRAGRRFHEDPEGEGADARFGPLVDEVDQAVHEADVALVGILRGRAEGTAARAATATAPAAPFVPGDWRAAEALLKFRAEAPARRAHLTKLGAEAKLAQKRAGEPLSLVEIRAMLPPRMLALLMASYSDEELSEAEGILAGIAPRTEPPAGG